MAGSIDKSISPEAQMAININFLNRLVASMRLHQSENGGEALNEDVEEQDQLVR